MSLAANQVHCHECEGELFKVLIFGTGASLVDHVVVCDHCNTSVNLLNVDTTHVVVTETF